MRPSGFLWQTPSRMDRLIGFLLKGNEPVPDPDQTGIVPLENFLSLQKKPKRDVIVALGKPDAYAHQFVGKSANTAELEKIAQNELRRLTPLNEGEEIVLARQVPDRQGVIEFLHVRQELIRRIESRSQALGLARFRIVPADTDQVWTPPSQHIADKRESRLMAVSLCCLVAAMFVFLAGVANGLGRSNDSALRQERQLRAGILARDSAERETGALGQIAAMQPEQISPAGRLATLAELTQNTPQNAWWTAVELNGTAIRLSGVSGNAAETLAALANAYPDRMVRFTQPVSTRPDGTEAFVISIEGKKT